MRLRPSLRAVAGLLAGLGALALLPDARAATPGSGLLSPTKRDARWTGSAPVQSLGATDGCILGARDPTCDRYRLVVRPLTAPANDVRIAVAASSELNDYDLFVYDAAGNELARSREIGDDVVFLRDVRAGDYTVGVQLALGLEPGGGYAGHAAVVDAGTGIDVESTCGTETSPVGQLPDPSGVGLVGDPFVIPDGLDAVGARLLRVHVLLDGITREEAHRIIRGARRDYDPLDVHLRLVRTVSARFATTDATQIIAKAKQLVGGRRPAGSDVVLVLTDKDIRVAGQTAVAGLADCIGGVAHADRAFAVAEARLDQDTQLVGPVFIDIDARAVVTAHEIGHLMGGQHHYANCAEGVGGPGDEVDLERRRLEVTPCTLMFNAANFIGHGFGTVNGTIVRGTASHHLPRA